MSKVTLPFEQGGKVRLTFLSNRGSHVRLPFISDKSDRRSYPSYQIGQTDKVTLCFKQDRQLSLPLLSNEIDGGDYPTFLPFVSKWLDRQSYPSFWMSLDGWRYPSFRMVCTGKFTFLFKWGRWANLPFLFNKVQMDEVTLSSFWTGWMGYITHPFQMSHQAMLTFLSKGPDEWGYPSFLMCYTCNLTLPIKWYQHAKLPFISNYPSFGTGADG